MSKGLDFFIREAVIRDQGIDYWMGNRYCIIQRLLNAGRLKVSSYKAEQKLVNNHAARRKLKRAEIIKTRDNVIAGMRLLENPPEVRMGSRHKRRRQRLRARKIIYGQR